MQAAPAKYYENRPVEILESLYSRVAEYLAFKFTIGTNYCLSMTKGKKSENSVPVVIRCSGCLRAKVIPPSCNQRNCLRCNKKRSNRLYKKYFDKMHKIASDAMTGRDHYKNKWRMITLTGFRIPFDEKFRARVKWFTDAAQKFLEVEYEKAGMLSIEMTVKRKGHYQGHVMLEGGDCQYQFISEERELYIHAHSVVFGGFKTNTRDNPEFNKRWGAALVRAMVEARDKVPMLELSYREKHERFAWLETVKNLNGSLNYILGYISKGIMVSDEELEAVKRLKYIRTWGMLYGLDNPEWDMYCADCGERCYLDLSNETIIDAIMGTIVSQLRTILVRRGEPPPQLPNKKPKM